MIDKFYDALTDVYKSADDLMPSYESNPCEKCNLCCRRIENLGIDRLELDYIAEFERRRNADMSVFHKFEEFMKGETSRRFGKQCPFFSESLKGCSIYEARPLACRTFACFINEKIKASLPKCCLIGGRTVCYNDSDFAEKLPFVISFYHLSSEYSEFCKSLK